MSKENKKIISEIVAEYNFVINSLLNKGLVRDYSCFSIKGEDICSLTRNNRNNESNILYDKLCSISDIADTILKNKEYNLLLYDKGIFQFELEIKDGQIIKERLIFIKKQNKLWNKEDVSSMDNDEFAEDWFKEEIGIPIIIRIDYDENEFQELKHPISHFTISNYDECRIPMQGPVSISRFINFILNIFYNEEIEKIKSNYDTKITITDIEKETIHFEWK